MLLWNHSIISGKTKTFLGVEEVVRGLQSSWGNACTVWIQKRSMLSYMYLIWYLAFWRQYNKRNVVFFLSQTILRKYNFLKLHVYGIEYWHLNYYHFISDVTGREIRSLVWGMNSATWLGTSSSRWPIVPVRPNIKCLHQGFKMLRLPCKAFAMHWSP